MKTAEFDDLCRREHEQGGGVVVRLHLTLESYHELLAEVLSEPAEIMFLDPAAPAGKPSSFPAGARLDTMTNPATHTPVSISPAIAKALFTDTAEVTRWVPARQPIPPEPAASDDRPPRDVTGYTIGG